MRWHYGIILAFGVVSCAGPPAASAPAPTVLAVPAGVPTPQAGWATAHYWLGSGVKDTETFTTRLPEWRLVWRNTKDQRGLLLVQVVDANSQVVIATATNTATTSGGTTTVRVPPGRYFLRVQGVFNDWAVAIEEPRP